MRIKLEPTASIKPHPSNPRRDHDVQGIAVSIRAFGFRQPLVVYDGDGHLLVGHGRLMAAHELGLAKVPVHHIGADELTADQAAAYRLADNRSAEASQWDDALLLAELEALNERERMQAGFDAAFLDELRRRQELENLEADPTEDEVPEPPAEPVTRPGDLWLLGGHRLLCGDATNATDVERVLGGVIPLLMVTDPPYGVDYDPDWRNRADRANGKPYGARAVGRVNNDDCADWREAWALFPGDVAYVWHAGRHASTVQISMEHSGLEIRCQIIWAKPRFAISRGDYHWQHEPCWYAVRKGKTGHWSGDRSQTTLWQITHQKSETGHGTQKPVEAMRRPMVNNSSPGQAVYDPFVGSGTSIIAAETTGRVCLAIDLDPIYVDVAVRRWQTFSGKKAILDGTGESFDDLSSIRSSERVAANAS